MTIEEYIRIAISGFPREDYKYYRPFFENMDCEHCIYNGFACKHPEEEDVCIEYRVEKVNNDLKKRSQCKRNTK